MTDKTGAIGAFNPQTGRIRAAPVTSAAVSGRSSEHAATADRADAVPASAWPKTGIVEVLGIKDFTDADAKEVRRAAPSAESMMFDDELIPDA